MGRQSSDGPSRHNWGTNWGTDPVSDLLRWGLTAAELRVLDAMRDADTEAAAAATLELSPHTVHAYLRSVRSKMDVHSTRQAILLLDRYPRSGVSHVV